jgi:DNA primase
MGKLRLTPDVLEKDFAVYVARQSGRRLTTANPAPAPMAAPATDPNGKGPEAHLLFLCLHHESLLRALAGQLPHEWIDQSHTAGRLLDRLLAEAAHNGWAGNSQIDQLLETQEEKTLIASLLFETPGDDDLIKLASEGLRALQRRFLGPVLRQIELEIATKCTDIDSDLSSLLKKRAEITRQLLNPPKLTLGS